MIVLATGAFSWWFKSVQKRLESFRGEQFINTLNLPKIEIPEINIPEINYNEEEATTTE